MEKIYYKILCNVGSVDFQGARLWCRLVLIEMQAHAGMLSDAVRQIRGLGWGGMPAFTVWIRPEDEVELIPVDGGVIARAGNFSLEVVANDFKRPIQIVDWRHERSPFGDEADNLILPYAGGQNYPCLHWTPIPERFKAKQHHPVSPGGT